MFESETNEKIAKHSFVIILLLVFNSIFFLWIPSCIWPSTEYSAIQKSIIDLEEWNNKYSDENDVTPTSEFAHIVKNEKFLAGLTTSENVDEAVVILKSLYHLKELEHLSPKDRTQEAFKKIFELEKGSKSFTYVRCYNDRCVFIDRLASLNNLDYTSSLLQGKYNYEEVPPKPEVLKNNLSIFERASLPKWYISFLAVFNFVIITMYLVFLIRKLYNYLYYKYKSTNAKKSMNLDKEKTYREHTCSNCGK